MLNEVYGYGYVKNELYLDNRQVPLTTLQITNSLEDVTFDKSVMLAVPMMFYKSANMKDVAEVSLTERWTTMMRWMKYGASGWMR